MKKLFVGIAMGVSLIAGAQTLEKSLLWKISGNGLTQPSYLYGTIHMTCDNSIGDAAKKAIGNTKQLFLELDMDDPAMVGAMMRGINMKDGMTIDQLISSEDYKTLDAFFTKKVGMSLDAMKTMKPMLLSAMLLPSTLGCQVKSIEEALMAEAKKNGAETLGLETVDEQLAVFDAIPYKDQVADLVKMARGDASEGTDELQKLQKLYAEKDLDALLEASEASQNTTMSGAYSDVLLKNRNETWIPRIIKLIKERPTFFGVGAAHLGGTNGVIRLLRKAGYSVEAVR